MSGKNIMKGEYSVAERKKLSEYARKKNGFGRIGADRNRWAKV